MAAHQHTPAAKLNDIPGELPTGKLPDNADYPIIAQTTVAWLNDFRQEHLAHNAIWRDLLALSNTFRTFYSIDLVFNTFQHLSKARQRSDFQLTSAEPRYISAGESAWLDLDVTFRIQDGDLLGECAGTISVTLDPSGQCKIWMMRTWLEYYDGHGHPDRLDPLDDNDNADGHTNGIHDRIYDVIVVGGGQAGLGASGRLKALNVDYVLFDDRPAIGDVWTHRYDSLKWHTIKEYGNLPFGRTFALDDDDLLPKARIGAGYKAWSERFGINVRSSTQVESAIWDEATERWTVSTSGEHTGEWKSKNLVLSIGTGHKTPISPDWASLEKVKASGFKGKIMHSTSYRNCNNFANKRGIVVGTANTAHDVAEDMANVGMATTMVQRNPTFIFPGEWLVRSEEQDYNLTKPTGVADREQVTQPNKIARELVNLNIWQGIKKNPERFDALEKAGFKVDRYGDLFDHLFNRFGGHYVDTGACARIVKGEIKMETNPVKGLTEDGLLFEDGSEVKADLIVLCTGFDHDFRKDAAEVVGTEIAEQMDDFGGLDKEGELRGYARLAGHPHLFYHGGETRLARFMSRFLALQLLKLKLCNSITPYLEGK